MQHIGTSDQFVVCDLAFANGSSGSPSMVVLRRAMRESARRRIDDAIPRRQTMRILPLAVCALTLVAAATGAAPARADDNRSTNGGSACHPANGAAAAKFSRANHYITNNNTTDQYVICHLPMDDTSGYVAEIAYLIVHVQAAGAGSVVCVAQTGSYAEGQLFVRGNVARSYAFSAAGSTALIWSGVLPRESPNDVLTLNCKLTPGMRLGLIERKDAFP
jgi:hypothetical protein